MIVRCNNCVSAFAVDDEKVADKKFAFTCPKCSTENIIDNRVIEKSLEEKNIQLEESYFNDDFSIDTGSPQKETDGFTTPDDLFFDEAPADKKESRDESYNPIEDEFASEFPAENLTEATGNKDRNLNLEIEESTDFYAIEDDVFAETAPVKKENKPDDIFAEVSSFEADDDFVSFDEKEKISGDEFGLELKDDMIKSEEDDNFFDDFDEKTAKKEPAIDDDSDFSFDDIDSGTIPEDTKSEREKKLSSQDDIDELFAVEGIKFDEKPISKESELEFEDEITVDLDLLDIDLEEATESGEVKEKPVTARSDEEIMPDMDNLDIDFDETTLEDDMFAEPVKQKAKAQPLEEDITLDMDNLDIDFEETTLEDDMFEKPEAVKSLKSVSKKIEFQGDEFDEEEIKLNLDDLDIDIAEIEERELIFEDEMIEQPVPATRKKPKALIEEVEEDESITIDLDTLEIEIAEENNLISGELSDDDDEKLTLDDAGLTFDELTSEIEKPELAEAYEEDMKLTLDDIDPDLTLEKITRSAMTETELVYDTLEELPEIDLDEYDAIIKQEDSRVTAKSSDNFEDDFIVFPDMETEIEEIHKPDYDIFEYEESEHEKSVPERGSTFFSIDLSLRYSRVGALLRLLGLYMISMIPHLVVMLIYTILSSIVGFINQIVILSTGRCVEDFAQVIENTMRYFFYIKTNITGIVEDRPVYAGREHIDHPLQLNITYPIKYSKNLAVMRLSIVGILLIMLPHLIIMSLITMTIPVVYLTGIIAVIFTRRWPNILFIYLTKYFRYLARISSFMTGLTDEYPPFNFD